MADACEQARTSSHNLQRLCEELDELAAFQHRKAASRSAASAAAAPSASQKAEPKEEPFQQAALPASSWQPWQPWQPAEPKEEHVKEEEAELPTSSWQPWQAAVGEFHQTVQELGAQELGAHAWAVRPDTTGRSTDLTPQEVARLRSEQAAATGVRWQDRGPVQTYDQQGQPTHNNWRGQPWREGTHGGKQRYAKRGVKNLSYYNELNKRGMLQPTRNGARVLKAPRHESRSVKKSTTDEPGWRSGGPNQSI